MGSAGSTTRDCPLGWCGSQWFLLRFLLRFLLPRTKPASTPNPTGTTFRRLGTRRRWALHTQKNKRGVRGGSACMPTTGSREQARMHLHAPPRCCLVRSDGCKASLPAGPCMFCSPATHWRLGAGRRGPGAARCRQARRRVQRQPAGQTHGRAASYRCCSQANTGAVRASLTWAAQAAGCEGPDFPQ